MLRPGALLVAALMSFSALAPSVLFAQTDPYFVGAWVFDEDTCYDGAPPHVTGDWDRNIAELIRATKYKFFSNGQVVVELAGKGVIKRGQWSFSDHTLKTDLGGGSVDVYKLISSEPDSFVALESSQDKPFTWLRCK
jgi:hypothetical protein